MNRCALIALVLVTACTPDDTPGRQSSQTTTNSDYEIDRLHAEWAQALREGNVDGALALLASDYVLWAAGTPPIIGPEAVRPLFTSALAAYDIDSSFESEERIVSGDLAVERGWDIQTIIPRDGGPLQTQRQRVFLVLKHVDGRWRYARGMSQPGPPED